LLHVARTRQIAHIDDLRTRQPYLDGNKAVVDLVDLGGARTLLIAMLKDEKLIGTISIYAAVAAANIALLAFPRMMSIALKRSAKPKMFTWRNQNS
jgi:hypothetical protein